MFEKRLGCIFFIKFLHTPSLRDTPQEGIFLMDTLQRVPALNKKGPSPVYQAIWPY